MGDVVRLRKPGMRTFPASVVEELYGLSTDIRELQIIQQKHMAQGTVTPKSYMRELGKMQSRAEKLLLNHCTKGCATDAKTALNLHACLNHREVVLIRGQKGLGDIIARMRTDVDQILARLFLWSFIPESDCERIKIILAYMPSVQARINEQLIANAG